MYALKDLEGKFSDIELRGQDALSSHLSEAECKVCDKVISKGPLYNVRPYEIERAGFKKGKSLKKIPANINNVHVYHFDADARIVFVEIYGQAENIINREFYNYSAGCVERVHFTSAGKIRNISVSLFDGEVVVKDLNWGGFGCSESSYVYADSRLNKILVQQKEHVDPSFTSFEVCLEYSANELVRILNVFPNGYEEQVYP